MNNFLFINKVWEQSNHINGQEKDFFISFI